VLTKVEEDGIELVSTRNQEVTRGRARDHVMGYCGLVSPITDTTQNAQQKKKKKKLAKFSESSIILLHD
jgi:2-keto-4-pentenoate hydratase/2-oxohepta-3-ene-1,7-dioic acid hydratase in catechol pathway